MASRRLPRAWFPLVLALLVGPLLPPLRAAPEEPVIAVWGAGEDAGGFAAAVAGARLAVRQAGRGRIVAVDEAGPTGSRKRALSKARRQRPAAWIALPGDTADESWRKALHGLKGPVWVLEGAGPDLTAKRRVVRYLGPTPVAEAIEAADRLLAPGAARRVGVVHEPTPHGRLLATTFARSLSRHITLAGLIEWPDDGAADALHHLETFEADWIYVALRGRRALRFVEALKTAGVARRCLFADGNRRASLLARAPDLLEGSWMLGGPDPELAGREGEDLVVALEEDGPENGAQAARAYEAARRALAAVEIAGSTSPAKVAAAVLGHTPSPGVLGRLVPEASGAVRLYPFELWRARKGSLEPWDDDLLPTPGCGPPIGFGQPSPAPVNERRGKVGVLTWGEGEARTIEADLLAIGLSTGGAEPELDAAIRSEILGRAIRIAHRLFRREADGTPIPGWSWGMTFAVGEAPEERSGSRVWKAIVAGDHPAAGGEVLGAGLVAVYSTFLRRTMYVQRRLEPPLSAADRPLLDGSYRWGEDRTLNFRANKLRCLVDGFSSAVALTLTHEFGHLCGCGHDTEDPCSIMNVREGAGIAWETALWIPSHQSSVKTSLGLE